MNLAASQGLVVGGLYIIAGLSKSQLQEAVLRRLALVRLLRSTGITNALPFARRSLYVIGFIELVVGLACISGVFVREAGTAAIVLGVLGLLYLIWGLRFAKGSTCGCFATAEQLSWRSIIRSVAIIGAATAYAQAGIPPLRALGTESALDICALAAEIALWVALVPTATNRVKRLARDLVDGAVRVFQRRDQLHRFTELIQATPYWDNVIAPDLADPSILALEDIWRDRGWTLAEYRIRWKDRDVCVVAGLLLRWHSSQSRIMLLDADTKSQVLGRWDSALS